MEQLPIDTPRVATVTEVASVAGLLDAFNREYDTTTPGKAVLAARLRRLLAGGDVIALLIGVPAVAVALLTLRPNVWYDGPVALLDELYVDHYISRVARLASPGLDELRWPQPVRPGDQLRIRVTVAEARASRSKPDRGLVRSAVESLNQDTEVVLSFTAMNFFARRPRS